MKTFIYFLLTSILLGGCINRSADNLTPSKPKWLHWSPENKIQRQNWLFCKTSDCLHHAGLVMEGLTKVVFDGPQIMAIPLLAEKWSEKDLKIWTFFLKQDVKWSDGTILEAKHFVQSWKLQLSNCKTSPYSSLLFAISKAREFCEGNAPFESVGISAREKHVLLVKLNKPSLLFPAVLSHPSTWPILDPKVPTGATLGPFLLDTDPSLIRQRFIRNPNYHGPKPALDGLEILPVKQASVRIHQFEDQETDLVDDIPQELLEQMIKDPNLHSFPSDELVILLMNLSRSPMESASLRHLVGSALDPSVLVSFLNLPALLARQLLPSLADTSYAGWHPLYSPTTVNKNLSELSKEKLFPLSPHFSSWKPTLQISAPEEHLKVLENIQNGLVSLFYKNLNLSLSTFQSDSPHFILTTFEMNPITPLESFEKLYSEVLEKKISWGSETFLSGIKKAGALGSPEVLYRQLSNIENTLIKKEGIVLPIMFLAKSALIKKHVVGLTMNPLGIWTFGEADLN